VNLLGTKSASPMQSKATMALLHLILPTLDLGVEESTMPIIGEPCSKTTYMTQVSEGETPVASDSHSMMEASDPCPVMEASALS
jgi:hypothetical protein